MLRVGKMALRKKMIRNRIRYNLSFLNKKIRTGIGIVVAVFLVGCIFQACKRNVGNPVDLKQDYFPISVGNWVIYDVVDIRHDINHDTLYYQIKEMITAYIVTKQINVGK